MGQQQGYVNPHGMAQQHLGPGQMPQPHQGANAAPGGMQQPGITGANGGAYPHPSGNFTRAPDAPNRAVATSPNPGASASSNTGTPLWMHGAVFAAFVGLGFGVAAFIKMML